MQINRNIQPQTAFCGSFRSNILLRKSLEYASPQDLCDFSKALKRMRASKDKKVFWLSEDWNSTPFSVFVKTHAIRLNKKLFGKVSSDSVGTESILYDKKYSSACYENVIKNINEILKTVYPEK